jgi:hypothetical protein
MRMVTSLLPSPHCYLQRIGQRIGVHLHTSSSSQAWFTPPSQAWFTSHPPTSPIQWTKYYCLPKDTWALCPKLTLSISQFVFDGFRQFDKIQPSLWHHSSMRMVSSLLPSHQCYLQRIGQRMGVHLHTSSSSQAWFTSPSQAWFASHPPTSPIQWKKYYCLPKDMWALCPKLTLSISQFVFDGSHELS